MRLYLADPWTPDLLCIQDAIAKEVNISTMGKKLHQPATVLISYHYVKSKDFNRDIPKTFNKPYPNIMLDSGAFSAYTQDEVIKIDEYCQFLHRYKKWIKTYISLDDMNSAEISLQNLNYMEANGLNPVPVFHTGEDFKYFEMYCKKYDYVALGKMVPYSTNKHALFPWLIKCHKIAKKYQTKLHGLGATGWPIMRDFPWHSVDSSSWTSGFRYGRISLFSTVGKRFAKIKLGDKKTCLRHASLISTYGFHYSDFSNRGKNTRSANAIISAMSYYRACDYITSLRKRSQKGE